ncbi:TadE/TadG family type IV pilus assembly protein [Arthrobacter sp. ISL-30]|uniref:TadE/TadG family type IV pilus assembly protein n=1 Tax=Arthrobacter sp. ISL-30 TaxID=2819109 RepID=UPI001BE69FA6|nr:TadE family protein [Arthrobacter sp. ISL-30]MBT2514375.1 pilus assembly protein [Arthrobacter sp. ISL-30]
MAAKRKPKSEAGAVAVEFALIIPIFLVLVLGIMEFGRAFNIQVSLSEAAREASRYAAVNCPKAEYDPADAKAAALAAAPSVPLTVSDVNIQYSGSGVCSAVNNVVVTVSYNTSYMTGLPGLVPGMPAGLSITSKGVMRCGG